MSRRACPACSYPLVVGMAKLRTKPQSTLRPASSCRAVGLVRCSFEAGQALRSEGLLDLLRRLRADGARELARARDARRPLRLGRADDLLDLRVDHLFLDLLEQDVDR